MHEDVVDEPAVHHDRQGDRQQIDILADGLRLFGRVGAGGDHEERRRENQS